MTPSELQWQRIEAQQKEIHAIIERDFSASRMNTTKWREVSECLAGFSVWCRIKFVHVADKDFELDGFWHVTRDWFDSGSLGPFTSISVEWLDINPLEQVKLNLLLTPTGINYAGEIEQRLQSFSVPYHCEQSRIRIVGHVRKGVP